jgi:hypothetical protein
MTAPSSAALLAATAEGESASPAPPKLMFTTVAMGFGFPAGSVGDSASSSAVTSAAAVPAQVNDVSHSL